MKTKENGVETNVDNATARRAIDGQIYNLPKPINNNDNNYY